MPGPSGVRLRESCQACALSKIKCSKDKPACTRCEERGTACQYLVTQKTGRKVGGGRRNTLNEPCKDSKHMMTPLSPLSPATLVSQFDFSQWESSHFGTGVDTATLLAAASTPDEFAGVMLPASSAMDLPLVDMDVPFTSLMQQHPYANMMNSSSDEMEPNHTSAQFPQDHESYSSPTQSLQQPKAIRMALQLMEQLCSSSPTHSPPSASAHGSPDGFSTTTLVEENKMVTETVTKMLDCSGSDDGYCLVLICLVLSKVLNSYTRVVQVLSNREANGGSGGQTRPGSRSSLSTYSRSTSASGSPTSKSRDPEAVPQLLDDLYQLRSLLDHIGSKIQACLNRDWMVNGELSPSGQDATMAAFPFSATILNQLHEGLRKRLSAISLEVLNQLKQFWVQ